MWWNAPSPRFERRDPARIDVEAEDGEAGPQRRQRQRQADIASPTMPTSAPAAPAAAIRSPPEPRHPPLRVTWGQMPAGRVGCQTSGSPLHPTHSVPSADHAAGRHRRCENRVSRRGARPRRRARRERPAGSGRCRPPERGRGRTGAGWNWRTRPRAEIEVALRGSPSASRRSWASSSTCQYVTVSTGIRAMLVAVDEAHHRHEVVADQHRVALREEQVALRQAVPEGAGADADRLAVDGQRRPASPRGRRPIHATGRRAPDAVTTRSPMRRVSTVIAPRVVRNPGAGGRSTSRRR